MSEINIRMGKEEDFENINDFVADAIIPAFDHPSLTDEQRQDNQRVVGITHWACLNAMESEDCEIWVAHSEGQLAGFIIANQLPSELPEIDWLIVSPEFHGKGVAQKLMETALDWIGHDKEVKLGVIHYNHRAIAFYEKFGFKDTSQISGNHKIPRMLMKRKI